MRFRLARLSPVLCFLSALVLSACSPPPPADAVLLGRLFDARNGRVIDDAAIVMANGRILCAGPRIACRWPRDAPVHDHGRAMLLPGLIDLHVHARPHYADTFVPAGVTTVRDANNTLAMLDAVRARPYAPTLIASGPMLDGPHGVLVGADTSPLGDGEPLAPDTMPLVVHDAAQARVAVAALVAAGIDWIKLYERMPADAFHAALAAAQAAGLPVMVDLGMMLTRGLSGADIDAVQAGAAGVGTLEHLGGVALAYRRLGGDPTAATLRDDLLDTLALDIAASGMAVVPTVAATHRFAGSDAVAPDTLPGAALLVPHFEAYWTWLSGHVAAPGAQANAAADLRLARALLPRLAAAGVRIGAGSDLPAAPGLLPGAALHQELDALVATGLSPVQALQAATSVAADILRRDDLGRLDAGARADIVVVDGDPTQDILATRRIVAVWTDGRPVDLADAWRTATAALDAAAAAQ